MNGEMIILDKELLSTKLYLIVKQAVFTCDKEWFKQEIEWHLKLETVYFKLS